MRNKPHIFKQAMPIMILCAFLFVSSAMGASLDKAEMLRLHGLVLEAKRELIEVIFSKQRAKQKAEAYYILGTVAFEENKIAVALETWTQLIKDFPESEQSHLVRDKIKQLSEVVGESSRIVIDNAIAQSYLRHADFWSRGKHKIFQVDVSWIPSVDAAVWWYDRVIQEFPKTDASRRAYEDKMRTLIGWKASGRYDQSHGIKGNFPKYIPKLLDTFASFESDHPEASSLQNFRYQIAQAYWIQGRHWERFEYWLNLIVEKSGESQTFYRDLAERHLKHNPLRGKK